MTARNLVVGDGVEMGEGVDLGSNVVIHDGTRIGDGCVVQDNVVLGKQPRLGARSTSKARDPLPPCELMAGAAVCSGALLYAGTVIGRGVCVENDVPIGAWCKIQSNSYVTAYSELEDHVFIAPCVTTTNDNFMGRTEARHGQIKGAIFRRGCRIGGGVVILRPRSGATCRPRRCWPTDPGARRC